MAIQFTNNLEQYTTTQRNAKVKQFTEFASKKKLVDAGILPQDKVDFVNSIKCIFTMALHNDQRYVAATLYRANAEQKYSFLVIDLELKQVAEVQSIKVAKAEILELVNTAQVEESVTDEAIAEPVNPGKKSAKKAEAK